MSTIQQKATPPRYIYKILPSSPSPPSPLPLILPVSALDLRDGFIHMSTSVQILGTLNNFFLWDHTVYVLRVPFSRVAADVKWEDAIGKTADEVGGCWDTEGLLGYFPHIYRWGEAEGDTKSLKLGRDEVDAVGEWKKGGGPEWTATGWPFGDEDVPRKIV